MWVLFVDLLFWDQPPQAKNDFYIMENLKNFKGWESQINISIIGNYLKSKF